MIRKPDIWTSTCFMQCKRPGTQSHLYISPLPEGISIKNTQSGKCFNMTFVQGSQKTSFPRRRTWRGWLLGGGPCVVSLGQSGSGSAHQEGGKGVPDRRNMCRAISLRLSLALSKGRLGHGMRRRLEAHITRALCVRLRTLTCRPWGYSQRFRK